MALAHRLHGKADFLRAPKRRRGIDENAFFVFVEKPLCLTLSELEQISSAYNTEGEVLLMVGFNRRFAGAITKQIRSHRGTFFNWDPKIVQYVSPQVWAAKTRVAGFGLFLR